MTVAIQRGRVIRYMWYCDTSAATADTNAENLQEPDPLKRDVVGYDCDAWAYDVQRPDEPYEARGPHPTGVGIDRYRRPTDLTPHERELLVQAKWLSLLNLVDPAMFGVRWGVPGAPPGWRMTGGFAYQLTSFGQAVTLDLYARGGDARWRAALRLYLSGHLALPGLELERVRLARTVGGARLEVTPTLGVWLQPAHDRFDDTAARPGALARLKLAWLATGRLSAFAEVQAKSAGWVAGTPRLDAAVEARVGVVGIIFGTVYLGGRRLDDVVRHVEHALDVAGEDAVAFGSDYDGLVPLPRGMRDVTDLPRLVDALARRRPAAVVEKVAWANWRRFLGETLG